MDTDPQPVQVTSPISQPVQPSKSHPLFMIASTVLLVVISIGGGLILLNRHGTTVSSSVSITYTTTSVTPSNAVPIISTTTIKSASAAGIGLKSVTNASCPCLSKQQLKQMLNQSATNGNAVFDVFFAPNNTVVRALQANTSFGGIAPLPSGILNNMTEGWEVIYATGIGGTAVETVMKSSNITRFADYMGSLGSSTSTGTTNGLYYHYTGIRTNTVAVEGYKGDYVIRLLLSSPAGGISASENAILNGIAASAT